MFSLLFDSVFDVGVGKSLRFRALLELMALALNTLLLRILVQ